MQFVFRVAVKHTTVLFARPHIVWYSSSGCEGYGAQVWCKNCYLCGGADAIQHSRATAKRCQERLIEKQSVKKARVLNIGDNIILPIPVSIRDPHLILPT